MRYLVAGNEREVRAQPLAGDSVASLLFTPDAPGEYQLSLAHTRRAHRLVTDAPLRLFVPPPAAAAHSSSRMHQQTVNCEYSSTVLLPCVAAAAAPAAAASLVQAFGEGSESARVGRFNEFGVYCSAAGSGQLSFQLCGPDVDADAHTSTLRALSDNQVYVLPATIDKEAGVVLVNYKVSDRGARPCMYSLEPRYSLGLYSRSRTRTNSPHTRARVGFYVLWIYFNGVSIPSAPFVVRAVHDEDARLQHPVRPALSMPLPRLLLRAHQ